MAVSVTNKSNTGCTVTCEGNDVIDLASVSPQSNRAIITRFKGAGTLQFSVTEDAADFVSSGYTAGEVVPPQDSLTRYARVTESGTKIIDIVYI